MKAKKFTIRLHPAVIHRRLQPGMMTLACLALLLFLFSCRKESGNPARITADTSAIFSATVAGADWKTDSVSAVLVGESRDHDKIITITGYTRDRVITFSLRDTSAVGSNDSTISMKTYTVNNWDSEAAFGYLNGRIALGRDSVWQEQGASISGQAVVSASDGATRRISGNFSFTARVIRVDSASLHFDTVNVSNGLFKNIPYNYLHHGS